MSLLIFFFHNINIDVYMCEEEKLGADNAIKCSSISFFLSSCIYTRVYTHNDDVCICAYADDACAKIYA